MSKVDGSFTAAAQSSQEILISPGNRVNVQVYGTWAGSIVIWVKSAGAGWIQQKTVTANGNTTGVPVEVPTYYKLTSTAISSGTAKWGIEEGNSTTRVDDEWEDLRFPAQSINPAGLTAAAGVDNTETDFPGTLMFDATTSEMCAGIAQMPHAWIAGTAIRPHIHWAKSTSAAGGVVWHFFYRLINRQAAPEAWSSAVVGADVLANNDTANAEVITTFGDINMDGRPPSTMVAWRLYRIPADAADTCAADARLFEVDFHYRVGSYGTGLEFIL